jgi:hypothetical protein
MPTFKNLNQTLTLGVVLLISLVACQERLGPDSTSLEQAVESGVNSGETLLFGDSTVEASVSSSNAGVVNVYPFTAVAGGSVSAIKIYADGTNTATSVQLAIYAQASAAPSSLVASCTASAIPVSTAGWYRCTATGTLTSGTTYYAGIFVPTGGTAFKFRYISTAGTTAFFKTGQATLPNPYGTGTSTASAKPSFTVVAVSPPTLLLGDSTVETTVVTSNAGTVNAFPFTASASGSVSSLELYVDGANTATSFQLGLYAKSTAPTTLWGSCTVSSVTANAWNSCTLSTGVSVSSGTGYFAAVLSPTGGSAVKYRGVAGSNTYYWQSSQSTLPATYSAGGSSTFGQISFQALGTAGAPTSLQCPSGYSTVAFRDDFNGISLDTTKWTAREQEESFNSAFTGITAMLESNVTVSGGTVKLSAHRHCSDPYVGGPTGAAIATGTCATSYYSGSWLTTNSGYAPGKGTMLMFAKMPVAPQGAWTSLWARNFQGGAYYFEEDTYEHWWDDLVRGTASDVNAYTATTHTATSTGTLWHTCCNAFGPYTNLTSAFHVYEFEWDTTATPAVVKVYYWDNLDPSSRTLIRTVTYADIKYPQPSSGVTDAELKTALNDSGGLRAYIDNAVTPPSNSSHVGPNESVGFNPGDVEVDTVLICRP